MAFNVKIEHSLNKAVHTIILREKGSSLNYQEEHVLGWIARHIGGKIIVLKKREQDGATTPDLKMSQLAEIKNTSGNLNTLDKHIRTAAKQTEHGWVFVNISGAKYTDEEAITTVKNRMLRSGLSQTWIIRDDKLIAHIIILE